MTPAPVVHNVRFAFLDDMPAPPLIHLPLATATGTFLAGYSEAGIASVRFPNRATHSVPPGDIPQRFRAWHRLTTRAVRAALAGRPARPTPPLDLRKGTAFQRSVWAALRRIPPGRARSYGEIARALGRRGAARAVGGACGANPIPLLIPCHRALAAGGRLGGFSGGLAWKRKLLAAEGWTPAGDARRPRFSARLVHARRRPIEMPGMEKLDAERQLLVGP